MLPLLILFGISSPLVQHCETWNISLAIDDFVIREILCVCHTFLANGQRLDYYLIVEGPAATCILCAFGTNFHKYACMTLGLMLCTHEWSDLCGGLSSLEHNKLFIVEFVTSLSELIKMPL